MPEPANLRWKIDECAGYFDRLHVCGWCFCASASVRRVGLQFANAIEAIPLPSFGVASPDVATVFGPGASHARFDDWLVVPSELVGMPFNLQVDLDDGTRLVGEDALTNCATGDPYFQSWENFIEKLAGFSAGTVLEIGSRARSVVTRRHRVPSHLTYLGLDVLPGANVDVVGDAHDLARIFEGRRFVAAFSTSVFEHLAMPWKVALELNRVLEIGGLVYTATHQAWPLHEAPWDFWRFSRFTWQTVFNAATGFEIPEAVMGEPARIHPCRASPVTRAMPGSPAYLGSAALVRKISETALTWPVETAAVTGQMYPSGELVARPTPDRV